MKTVTAVRCMMCNTLHGIEDVTYSIIWGGAKISVNQRVPLNFGTQDEPTIICASPECLQRLFKTVSAEGFAKIAAVAALCAISEGASDLGFGVRGIDYD